MKTFLKNIFNTLIILLSVFLLGIFLPILTSSFISLTTEYTFNECVQTGPFWFFTLIGWGISIIYVDELIKKS